ncbi:hypothetical protein M9H77_23025 [Catharanthus roseus]|uniref:Uncharacterized protein n=1 Tax=Catharanthus roseus TaxID=4058 RepID=A0ACC0ARR7_CATRO|nr:hypothetical protein M9H77_23025 [Catharanthus roseus]
MSIDGNMPTQSHQGGLARQYQSVASDVEELKKGKSSSIMEKRVGGNLGGFNSPHYRRLFDNVSTYEYHDMPVQNSHPFHEGGYQGRPQLRGGRRGGLGGRGYYRQEEYPRHEAWHDNNFMKIMEITLTLAKHTMAKQLKSHKDQIEQEKFQGLNFDIQDLMGLKF